MAHFRFVYLALLDMLMPQPGGFMRARLNVTSLLFAAFLFAASTVPARAADTATTQPSTDATGTWKWTAPGPGGDIDFTLKIKQDGDKLTGSLIGFDGDESPIADGKLQNGQLTFKVTRDFNGNPITTLYTATLAGGELKGKSETIFAQDFEAKRDQQ
jgi:hypothetical protein